MQDKLVKILTHKLEEYGMPKFKDNHPALDVIQTMKDFGYIHIEDVLECLPKEKECNHPCEVCELLDCASWIEINKCNQVINEVRQALENLGKEER